MDSKELVSIGRIVGSHGYKGTVKVEPLTDFLQRFQELKEVKLYKTKKIEKMTVESCSPYKGLLLMKLQEISNKEDAQSYHNALLCVDEDDVYPLPKGYYYHFQLVGLAVHDTQKGYLGTIIEILETGANDVYVVDSPVYGEILIPAIKQVILEVDLEAGSMQVKLLDGLLD
ncbi:16S rRNA processing protein RimM [Syntrophomonas zehnderi OL-4]|uniref:Ribosome maturation factor RimM n=1 Tax=Syntrophomonas zehnderi OL-4 TaxID=690567 RepID=A0A0E4GBD4_9FIRM|nr:16S rRNA processing protein RimM [Syntrophomonas zehnderi OL-4]